MTTDLLNLMNERLWLILRTSDPNNGHKCLYIAVLDRMIGSDEKQTICDALEIRCLSMKNHLISCE